MYPLREAATNLDDQNGLTLSETLNSYSNPSRPSLVLLCKSARARSREMCLHLELGFFDKELV